MIATEHYLRYHRIEGVRETRTGLLADLHGEQLRIDVVRPDVVRLKLSRGGAFDESPTFAVCVDPLSDVPAFTVRSTRDAVELSTTAMTVTLGLDPFRLDIHRADGSTVLETAVDADGVPWTYATLNDAFSFRRRVRREDAIFGLGEKAGRHNRKGRDFTLWNTDVLSPSETAEFTRDKAPADPRGDRFSADFDPFYVSIPFFYHQNHPGGAMSASFLDNGYRSAYAFSAPEEYQIHVSGGQYTEYVFAGPDMPAILEAYTWLTGRMAAPDLVTRLSPVPLVRLHPGRGRADRPPAS